MEAANAAQQSSTLVDWIPLLVAAISIMGAAIIYAYQRSIDRYDKLREKRQAIYEKYLHCLIISANQSDPEKNENDDRYQLAKISMFVLAPEDVVVLRVNTNNSFRVAKSPGEIPTVRPSPN